MIQAAAAEGGLVAAVNSVKRNLSHIDFVVLSLYWVAIGYLWTSLGGLILPDMVIQLVGRDHEGFALGVLEAVGSLMAVVWQPIAGALSDRTTTRFGRRRPYIVVGTIGDVLFLIGLALSGTFGLVLILYFLMQAASNTAQGPYQALMPDVVPEPQRGTASGYFGVANVVGLLAGTLGSGYILAHAGRTAALLSICALLILTMLATVWFIPDRATRTAGQFKSVREAIATTFARPLRYPAFLWLMASRLLILLGLVGVQSFVFFYFNNVFFHNDRIDTITASYTLLGLVIFAAFVASWPAARASDRFGRRPFILVGGLMGALGVLMLVFSHYQLLPPQLVDPLARMLRVPTLAAQATLVGVLIGIGYGVFFSVDWAFIQDVIPTQEAGLFMGFSNIATAGSGIIARFIGGFLLDPFNHGPKLLGLPGGFPVIFSIFSASLLIGALLILKVPEARKR
ncbi:MAG TPA: MFS transporter [Candidatus Micrarchaeaceae archaeon]|nr:MFS transporter [Candidatus Micrarchaeaceae archaeon]